MLIDCLGTTEEFAQLFSDRSVLEAMLRFEIALARAQARLGMIPQTAADAISRVQAASFDADVIAREARVSGSVAVPFARALRSRPGCEYAHWGATSQDVMDTALILLLARAREILQRDHNRLAIALRAISERHKDTVMLARTLMQAALPTTFGYKVAGWYASVARSWRRLAQSFDEALVVQFGGAAGTLASHGDRGAALASELAQELRLGSASPWHAHRDRLAAVVANLGIYTGALGKIARDLVLLMQTEVGEVSQPAGGSSAMPHKRNPAGSVIVAAAASRVPSLVGAYLGLLVQEHERAAGSWQAEWPIVADVVCSTGSAVAALADVMDNLEVSPEQMRQNLDATCGVVLSERAVMLLAPQIGHGAAQRQVAEAVQKALEQKRPLGDILNLDLGDPEDYLGCSEILRRKLLEDRE